MYCRLICLCGSVGSRLWYIDLRMGLLVFMCCIRIFIFGDIMPMFVMFNLMLCQLMFGLAC